jgi:hypothetical protein
MVSVVYGTFVVNEAALPCLLLCRTGVPLVLLTEECLEGGCGTSQPPKPVATDTMSTWLLGIR